MSIQALRHPGLFDIRDALGTSHGCNQEWFRMPWQRMAGCGPCAATHLIQYARGAAASRDAWVALMHEAWVHVTPGMRGLDRVDKFTSGMDSYAQANGLIAACRALEVSPEAPPALDAALAFLADALQADLPVAFLNLDSGAEATLESWHWVTIVSLERRGAEAIVGYLDNGADKRADIALWLATTRRGGGFATASLCARER